MPSTRIFLSALVAILALLPSPVLGQARTVDVRASVGYAYLLDDSPPYAWVGGGTVTVPRGVHSRFGVEGWYASLFGPYNHPGKAQARLVTALWEYAFPPWSARQPVRGCRGRRYAVPRLVPRLRPSPRQPRLGHTVQTPRPRWPGCPVVSNPACLRCSGSADRLGPAFPVDGRARLRFLSGRVRGGEWG